jgi:hypothetical protein
VTCVTKQFVWTKKWTTINKSLTSDTSQTLLDFSFQCPSSTSNTALPPPIPSHSDVEIEHDESNGSDSEAETKEEWLDLAQLAELAHRYPSSRISEAMTIEVCL